ncbi:MAG: cytochrome c biogenesis protein CcsA [Pseudomonadota bacterium]
MSIDLLAPVIALLYLAATGLQLLNIAQRQQQLDRRVVAIGTLALVGHSIIAWDGIFHGGEASFGFFKIAAMLFLVVNIACLLSLITRPLQNLLVVLFPLSALAVLVSTYAPDTDIAGSAPEGGLLAHIVSSILAYAVLTLAALQAMLVSLLDHQLRHRHTRGVVQVLPPLQLMERMLFELLWIGVVLLSASIATGMIFLDDMFAQQLVHKTTLTIAAWILFTVLLWGHYQLGWRSQTAVRFTLVGFALLVLAFFGSKLVLELILA